MKGIAEELADQQREISISEFFEKNKHMLGFDSDARALVTTIKEALDNALDVCEDMEVLPEIHIEIDRVGSYLRISVEDNGPGIPEDNVGDVFGKILYGSRFGKPLQKRGQQGIGISAAVLYSQLTTNEKAQVITKTKQNDKAYKAKIGIDTDTNEPTVEDEEYVEWGDKEHGTQIELKIRANLRARKRLVEYLENTNIANPHAKISYNGVKKRKLYDRASEKLPRKPEEIKPHPHGIEEGDLKDILNHSDSYSIKGVLENDFSKVGSKTADSIITKFKNAYYGKKVVSYCGDVDFESVISESVSGKKKEDVDLLVQYINDNIGEATTKSNIIKVVNESAEEVESENDTRIGSTVRENVVSDLWEDITANSDGYQYYYSIIDDNTTSRKKDELLKSIAKELSVKLNETESIKYSELNELFSNIVREKVDEKGGKFGEKAVEKVVNAIWDHFEEPSVEVPNVKEILKDPDMLTSLHYGMQETKVNRPSSKCLSPITPEGLEKGLKNNYEAEFYATTKRDTSSHSGHPFIVEAGIAYDKEKFNSEESIQLDRFANRVPLVYQQGACQITRSVESINWRNYSPKGSSISQSGGRGIPQGSFVLVVHVASTNVPFTSESKDAVAGDPNIDYEVEQAVREVARDLKSYLKERSNIQRKKKKRNIANKILPDMAEKFSEVAGVDIPDTGLVVSNITDSILIQEKDDQISVYNKTGKRRKIKVVLENVENIENSGDFEQKDGDLIWEETVYSSHKHHLEVEVDYSDVKVKGVKDKFYMIEKQGDI